ncbi:MAG TPA: uroporphyrinogen-III synthase [Candidatus Polarisedimenticolaceae bacterium]|nr:uroporphyrinogen-III synthase [Candidatus Polarisedimenticolaceae bacterium]
MRILVTRPPGAWPGLAARFPESRVAITMAPTTIQVEPQDPVPGDEAIARLDSYDWLVVTSGQGVRALVLKLAARDRTRLPARMRVAAVGSATARALEGMGAHVELTASDQRAEGLASEMRDRLRPASRVVLVRPEGPAGLLAASLRAAGAHVDEAPLYRTVAAPNAHALARAVLSGAYDAVVFTAPSALQLWLEAAGPDRAALAEALARMARVAIGPTTAAHLQAHGLSADAVAAAPTEEAVGDAIARVLARATW